MIAKNELSMHFKMTVFKCFHSIRIHDFVTVQGI